MLACSATKVPGIHGEWTIKVLFGEDADYGFAGYRRSCHAMKREPEGWARWWIIWEKGQSWYAEVTALKTPPVSVAHSFARALGGSAWDDCSGMS